MALTENLTDTGLIIYCVVLFLIIAFAMTIITNSRKRLSESDSAMLPFMNLFIDLIYDEFTEAGAKLIDKMSLIGINNYDDFLQKVKEALLAELQKYVDNAIKDNVKYKEGLRGLTTNALNLILDQIFEESFLAEYAQEKYDELIAAVEASAEKYEKEVSEENKSFEDGTADVPEYIEEEEPEENDEEPEVDESELEESID